MSSRTAPPRPWGELPTEVQRALGALRDDGAADPEIDAVHEAMRARFHALLDARLGATDPKGERRSG